jgi:hypothetical protein
MANKEHLEWLKQGVATWNQWKDEESIKKLGVTPLGVFPPAVDPDTSAGTWSQAPDSGF